MTVEDKEYRRFCLEKIAKACLHSNMIGSEIALYLRTLGVKLKPEDYELIQLLADPNYIDYVEIANNL